MQSHKRKITITLLLEQELHGVSLLFTVASCCAAGVTSLLEHQLWKLLVNSLPIISESFYFQSLLTSCRWFSSLTGLLLLSTFMVSVMFNIILFCLLQLLRIMNKQHTSLGTSCLDFCGLLLSSFAFNNLSLLP